MNGQTNFIAGVDVSLALLQNMFTGIDLSSLEEIRGFGVAVALNPNLCYLGDIVNAVENSSYTNILVEARKDITTCSESMMVCKRVLLHILHT